MLCLILFGILRFGLLFYNYIDLTSATRDGARKASVSRNDAGASGPVKSSVTASTTVVDDSKATITVSPAPPWASGTDVTVKVSYPYKLDLLGLVVWNGPLTSESVVRVE